MKALFFAILRGTLVIAVGVGVSAAVALWLFSGKAPTSIKGFREATKELSNFHLLKKQMVERSYNEAEMIKDDSDLPAGINSGTTEAAEAEAANLAKLNAEIAEATKGVAQEKEQIQKQEMLILKNKLARLQTQLDRIENQNRILRLKISGIAKNSKIKDQ
ncbi:MAG: hypothetical protein K0R29_1915 [Pseudobdellovibrio sp.]|jgi:hypothetical protein|nr:hypothetical protein [Pseudobdellovibrio sp.]